jgi:GDPmannose 4,6-dehydratase
VTRKITRAASRIAAGLQSNLSLGNLDAKRDWGFAPEYCEGMWRILQHKKADDFVLATGQTNTVKEFVELSFKHLGVDLEWKGKGVNEKGVIRKIDFGKAKSLIGYNKNSKLYKFDFTSQLKKGNTVVTVNPNYYRPTEVELLIGDPTKAKKLLGWKAKTKFEDLVQIMIKSDMDKVLRRGY